MATYYILFQALAIIVLLLKKFIGWFFHPYTYYKRNLFKANNIVTFHTGDSHSLIKSYDLLTNQEPIYDLSIVIPSYNEEKRLPETLDKTIEFLSTWSKEKGIKWEVIVVNDGSKDKTITVIQQYCKKSIHVKGVDYNVNSGKGAAVKKGMLCSNGRTILMMDADLATDLQDIPHIYEKLNKTEVNGLGMVVGTRKVVEKGKVVKRSAIRKLLMFGFHCLLKCLCKINISDTQCGFKIFSRKAAAIVFPAQHLERFAFDIELCMLAQKNNIPIDEQSVTWTEIPGSKVNILKDGIVMGRDVVITWLLYLTKIWKVSDKTE
jgi:dolichyl-phosphate beta-glucosyltransferase